MGSGPSIFSPVVVKAADRGKRVLRAAWSTASDAMLLAVGLVGGSVIIVREDGELHEEVVKNRQPSTANVCCLEWSPTVVTGGNMMLALGWEDGSVMVWSEKDRMTREDGDHHAPHPVSFVKWSPDSSRLISGDARPAAGTDTSVLAVWKVDTRGRLSTICPYRKPATGGITHAIFRTSGQQKRVVTSAFAAADCPPFYFGGELGHICYGDDLGHCNDAISGLGSAIASMLYYAEKDLLLIITRLHMLEQYKLTDNKPTQLIKTKLSVGKEGLQDAIWAGPGQLAFVSADQLPAFPDADARWQVVRFSDVTNDENYVLSLADVPGMEEHSSDKLVTLAHHRTKGLLAAGTKEGRVLIWRQNPGLLADSLEKSWTPLAPVQIESKADHIVWGSRDGLLAVSSASGLHLLPETVLHRSKRGKWALVQLASSQVSRATGTPVAQPSESCGAIESVHLEHEDGTSHTIETNMRIRGADLHKGHVVLWSGTQIEVIRYGETDELKREPPSQISQFEAKATAVVIWEDHLFICAAQGVYVANFSGSPVANMPFADAEGEPRVLHAAGGEKGSFVAVGTDKGVIKVKPPETAL
ncbi:MAG: hypothetical protein SGPRY_001254 [Prymnesium sp.]